MNSFDGTPVLGLSGACVRAIDSDYSCAIGRERNRAMAKTPDAITVRVNVIEEPRPSCGGKSILEMIWEELDEIYGQLMMAEAVRGDATPEHANLRGHALGLAKAISIIVNPYAPNVDAVRAEARARWEAAE